MTSVIVERFGAPTSRGAARMLELTRCRAADELAARTVWCATGLPARRPSADRLRAHLEQARDAGVALRPLDVAPIEPLAALARRLDEMLGGAGRSDPALGAAERETCTAGLDALAQLLEAVGHDDVVVVHDPLTAMLAPSIRDRGAHVVWHVHLAPAGSGVHEAWTFLGRYTAAVDAYIVAWREPLGPSAAVEHVAALMPAADRVEEKDVAAGAGEDRRVESARDVAWSTMLADVAQEDRGEHVGGRLHPRPAVAVR